MPYPYTLTPDGHTLEPEDVVKPPAESQADSTSTQSPHLDFGNPLPPAQQTPPTKQPTGKASSSKSDKPGSTGSAPREIRPLAPVHRLVPPDILDINPDAVGSLEQHIAALNDGQPIAGSAQSIERAPTPETDEFGHTPLTAGQAQHVEHLLAVETNSLAREVLIT